VKTHLTTGHRGTRGIREYNRHGKTRADRDRNGSPAQPAPKGTIPFHAPPW